MLSDRFGARPFATLGPLLAAVSFFLLARLPVDFPYVVFPLYRYVSDLKPGQITGQGNTSFGGAWWVVSAAGNAITKTA